MPIQAVGARSCTKCGRPISLAPTPDGGSEHAHEKLKVFVSYSRKDKDFVVWFSDALQAQDVNVFRDLDDILPTEEWWPRIEKLIAAADTVVFVVSPDSVSSEICTREIAVCEKLNKRIAPIVLREVAGHLLPSSLAKLNQVFFTARHEYDQALATLAAALRLDIGWIREHTRIGELAMRWDSRGRTGGLLEGDDLIEAEAWRDRRPKSAPPLTELQRAFIERSRQAASDRAKSDSDVILGLSLYAQKNYPAARDAWTRAANLGNPAAMTHIAKMLADGVGAAADPREALKWFRKAADLGDLEAMTYLGALHEWGELGETDLDQAAQWYRRAAAAGQLQAMTNLAGLLLRGGNEDDVPEARRLLSHAAEARYPVAMNGMGELCRVRDKDDQEAERWFREAAERGNAAAMVNLGTMYQERRAPAGRGRAALPPRSRSRSCRRDVQTWRALSARRGSRPGFFRSDAPLRPSCSAWTCRRPGEARGGAPQSRWFASAVGRGPFRLHYLSAMQYEGPQIQCGAGLESNLNWLPTLRGDELIVVKFKNNKRYIYM